jgi:hypothetical protein
MHIAFHHMDNKEQKKKRCGPTSGSIRRYSVSSSSTSKYSSVEVMETVPGATTPGATRRAFVLIFTGPAPNK